MQCESGHKSCNESHQKVRSGSLVSESHSALHGVYSFHLRFANISLYPQLACQSISGPCWGKETCSLALWCSHNWAFLICHDSRSSTCPQHGRREHEGLLKILLFALSFHLVQISSSCQVSSGFSPGHLCWIPLSSQQGWRWHTHFFCAGS